MPSFMELSNIAPPKVWGVWEPLAFFFLTAGAAAAILACAALWRRASAGAGRLFGVVALASGLAGQACLLMGLEQPLRAYELYLRPHFISWTAWGGFLIPLCLLCTVPLVWPRRKGRVHPLWFLPAIGAACAVFIYADSEIMDCVGRVLWARPLLPMGFILAGLSAAFGFTCLMAPRTDGAFSLLPWASAAAAFVCALAALAFRAPEGFAQFATYWWHAPETICLIAAVIAAIRPRRWFRLTGAMTCVSAFMVFWKIIHMGQAFGRNASTFSDAAAFLDIVSPGSLLILAGGAGLWLALALLLSMLFPWNAAKEPA